ncbi:MlaA family lipoprotein [Undibacterium terreum]|uniref:Phospholipid-binding lipoprotein MlaA n=1 Tax=Undibacterium terreum TaxID=1224302 RepID=A0A916XPE3_9BURK|nr:VacJ family lipoprotein [Undibacterium terreum]GGC89323.1 hypothetical protein GCM10011396_40660 [Undibacterium terreum]
MKLQNSSAALIIAASLLLSACATTAPSSGQAGTGADSTAVSTASTARNPRDPFEGFNRAMFSFNDTLDRVALKPAAKAYQTVLPSFVQTGIGNFFSNIGDVWNAANNFLQGKGTEGMNDVFRFGVNTVFGLGGVLDIATEAGMPKHQEDFGQTLGTWGVKSGPYVVLPLFGSSTLRDTLATPIDIYGDPWAYVYPVNVRNTGTVLRLVDKRASVLDAGNLIEEASLDKYVFFRDAYLQRRASQINKEDD